MTVHLLDANVLIALTIAEHEHHDRATEWFSGAAAVAVCPVVEGALTRFLLRLGESAEVAVALLNGVRESPRCSFWPDDLSYVDLDLAEVRGHRQVTDAYLVGLAVKRGGLLATFDRNLTLLRPHGTLLLP